MEEISKSWRRLLFLSKFEGLDEDSTRVLVHRLHQGLGWGMAVASVSVLIGMGLKSQGFFRSIFSEKFNETKTAIAILFGSLTTSGLTGSYFLYLLHVDSTKIYYNYLKSGAFTHQEAIAVDKPLDL